MIKIADLLYGAVVKDLLSASYLMNIWRRCIQYNQIWILW